MNKLLEVMIIVDATDSTYLIYNGVGEVGKDHSRKSKLELRLNGEWIYIPMAGSIRKKEFPELKILFYSDSGVKDTATVEDDSTIKRILEKVK